MCIRDRHNTVIEELLPVTMMEGDDREEHPEGLVLEIDPQSHPLLAGMPEKWPPLLGYNKPVSYTHLRDVTVDKLIEYMVGRSLSQVFPGKHNVIGDIVLEARDISSGTEVRNVSFYLKQGEILGFAGLVGAGRTETLKAVFGADPKSKGQIMINGRTVPIHSPGDAIHRGIGFVPEDRKREGLVTELSVMDNVVTVSYTHLDLYKRQRFHQLRGI